MTISLCRACGETFQSLSGFDEHRIGKYEKRDEKGKVKQRYTRRCLAPDEMRAIGLATNERGRWGHPLTVAQKDHLQTVWKKAEPVAQLQMAL